MSSTEAHAVLEQIQSALEHVYELTTPCRAADFVISDPHVRAYLCAERTHTPDEELFVRSGEDGLELSLWLAPDLCTRLSEDRLAPADFTLAVEGVSHFLYVVRSAGYERTVTALELELQAEIDKLLGLMLFRDDATHSPRHMHRWLYSGGTLAPDLTPSERERYRKANQWAARYWLELLERHPKGADDPRLTRELRRFYRLPRELKLARVSGC